jgi:radical SAM protein with 4Fe4S-binding SPASM domain
MKINFEYQHIGGKEMFQSPIYKEYRKKWEQNPQSFIVEPFPLFIDVDITNVCNLKCPFCSRQVLKRKENKFMNFDIVKKIINEGSQNNLYGIKFNILAEPLIHPQLIDFVKYAKDKGLIDVYFNTNATMLSEDMSEKLIKAKLDRISISFEGCSKEIYEKYRVGATFEKVVQNIKNLQKMKMKLNSETPKVRIQTVSLPDINISEYKNYWFDVVDEIGVLKYQPRTEILRCFKSDWICPQLWQRMGILVDGTIIPCNHDEKGLLSLGNIKDTSIKDAWNLVNLIRHYHKAGNAHLLPACSNCYLRRGESV